MSESSTQHVKTCPAEGFQKASVCVPVTVTPFAIPGNTTTFCCGEPIVKAGTHTCEGKVGEKCSFTITQNICVAVPIEFGATSTVGDAAIKCGEASSKDVCKHCSPAGSSSDTSYTDCSLI